MPFASAHGSRSSALFSRASSPDLLNNQVEICSRLTSHADRLAAAPGSLTR